MKKRWIIFIIVGLGVLLLSNYFLNVFFLTSEGEVLAVKVYINHYHQLEFSYLHSVARTPVQEVFALKNNKFILKKTVYQSYGAGLPLDGGVFSKEKDKFVRSGQNTEFAEILFRVSRTPEQKLKIAGASYELQELEQPGRQVKINSYSIIPALLKLI